MMTADFEILEARISCSALIADFAHHVDHREFDKAVALFAEDGAFLRPDLEARGHEQIARIWEGRPETHVTKHFCALPHFTELTTASAAAVTSFQLFMCEWSGQGLPPLGTPVAIAEFRDRFVKTKQGWRIAERRGVPIIVPAVG